jgi:hypothetical protein
MRRLPILMAGALVAPMLACSSAPLTIATVPASPSLTGYVLAYTATNGSFRTWFGNQSPTVGDNNTNVFGESMRAVITFALPAPPTNATLRSATLAIAQCQGTGAPFASLGDVVADHLVPTFPPDSATYDTTAMATAVATIAADSSLLTAHISLKSSVAADYAAGNTTSMFRLRFSTRDNNGGEVTDNVVFCPPTLTLTFAQ